MKRIGALVIGNADVPSFNKELREGLRDLGQIEGEHYVVELRSAEAQLSRLPELAAELVRLRVDVIVAFLTPCGLAAKQATREIPIVIVAGDPLGAGLVESLPRPGANVTGLSLMAAENLAKCGGALPRDVAVCTAGGRNCQCRRSGVCEGLPRTSPSRWLRHRN